MQSNDGILSTNHQTYQDFYSKHQAFLRYPADWVIRFHNMYLRSNIPSGRVLDYGCGGGNNSTFFIEQGYEVFGVDIAEAALPLIKLNLENRHLDPALADRFSIISPDSMTLPFEDNYFDLLVANQVLYYLPTEQHIRSVCKDMARVLRPGGTVFFTMMGSYNNYITHHTKQIHNGRVYEIRIEDPDHRLSGVSEIIFLVRDRDDLKDLFSEFDCISTGYFDQSMFEMNSNFHWIFIGKNQK